MVQIEVHDESCHIRTILSPGNHFHTWCSAIGCFPYFAEAAVTRFARMRKSLKLAPHDVSLRVRSAPPEHRKFSVVRAATFMPGHRASYTASLQRSLFIVHDSGHLDE
jgi:hypothetical protein